MPDPVDPQEPGDDERLGAHGPPDDPSVPDGPGRAERHPGRGFRSDPGGWWGSVRDEINDRVAAFDGGGLRLAVAGAAVVALGLAGWWLLRPGPAPAESALPSLDAVAPTSATAGDAASPSPVPGGATADPGEATGNGGGPAPTDGGGAVTAHAAGAVANPGVYRLDDGTRVADLVHAAGGLAAEADVDRLNLAAPVTDGARVYVPARGQAEVPEIAGLAEPPPGGGAPAGGSGTAAQAGPSAPVDLNAAGAVELEVLPGIGPATSAAILEYRTTNGGFASVDELIEVSGIGDAKMATLRDLVTV